ncbi:MAG: nuclear transport factor 2 family protein [Actinomycetota bacterium]
MDLQQLSDRIAISDFLTAYARAVDTKDWDAFRSLFTDDAHIDYSSSGGIEGGVDEVASWMETTMSMFSTTQHIITNETVTIDGDTASVHAVLFNPMVFDGADTLSFTCGGGYDHDLVRVGDDWKSRRVVMTMSWTTMGS